MFFDGTSGRNCANSPLSCHPFNCENQRSLRAIHRYLNWVPIQIHADQNSDPSGWTKKYGGWFNGSPKWNHHISSNKLWGHSLWDSWSMHHSGPATQASIGCYCSWRDQRTRVLKTPHFTQLFMSFFAGASLTVCPKTKEILASQETKET